jgi:hypothetical protein
VLRAQQRHAHQRRTRLLAVAADIKVVVAADIKPAAAVADIRAAVVVADIKAAVGNKL